MEFTVTSRAADKKSESKKIRREGGVPAVIYSQGKKGEEIIVSRAEFQKVLQQIEPGTLSTKIIVLNHNGKKIRAVFKDIQYHPTTYNPVHFDFVELVDDVPVNINVPLQCIHAMECVGVKLGGVLRQVIRQVKVRCLPKDIPSHFELDIKDMELHHTKKLRDILNIPNGVRPLIDLKEVAVVISKR